MDPLMAGLIVACVPLSALYLFLLFRQKRTDDKRDD